jgi:hypothetical protein
MRKYPCVSVQGTSSTSLEKLDLPEVPGLMDPEQLLLGSLSDSTGRASVHVTSSLEMAEDCLETFGTFGVPSRDAMLDHPSIGVQSDGHGSSRSRRRPWSLVASRCEP